MNEKVLVLLLLCSLTVSAAVVDVSDLEIANAAKVVCGDTVRLMRGREFHGQLVTKPGVVYTCFGEGPKPVVCHSLACDGRAKWTRPLKGRWHTWRSVVTSAVEVTSVILDEDRGGRWTRCVRKASLDELKKDRDFWWNPKDGAVYFQFWCNPSDKYGRIELVQAGDAIVAADGVKVEGLSVRGAGGAAIGGKARGVTVRNCDFLGVGAGIRLGEACRVERCRFNGVTGDVFMGQGLVCRDNVMWDVRRVAEDAAALDFAFNTCVTTNTPGVDAQKNLRLKPRKLSNAGWDFAAISRYDFRIVAQGEGKKAHNGARDMPGSGVDQSAPYPAAIPADAKLEVRDAGGARTYPVPGLIRSREWSATVNGVACGVAFGSARFECWAEQGGPYGIVQFEMTRPVKLEVRTLVGRDLSKVAILPRGAPVKLVGVKDGVISLEVLKPCKFSIDPDEWDRGCFVFANAPMTDVPDAKDPKVTVLEPGVHRVKGDVYRMKSGETLYFKPGAVLQAGIDASDAADIRICGNGGYLDGSPWCRDDMPQYSFLHFTRCRDVRLEDIVLRSSWHWTTFPQGCDRMTVRNLKTCGGGNSNDDGIDPSNTRDLTIVDSFFRTQDDCIAVKGIDRRHGPCERMLVTNCVFMTGYARVILLGHESKAEHMRDMRMVDCDVLHYVRPIFLVEPGEDMPIEDIRFENVRAHTDLHPRTEATVRFQPIVNVYTSKTPGHVRDITVDGLHLYGPRIPLKFWISGYDEAHRSTGVTLRNVEINGTPLVWESAARTTDEGAEDVWFDGENHPDKLQRAYGIGHWVDSVTLDSRTGKPITLSTGKDAKGDESGMQPAAGRRLSLDDYRDRMQGGWIGQIAGVAFGAPTEFKWKNEIVPADALPTWRPEMINDAFWQDDIYVEMTFLRTLEQYGLDASIRQAGIDFANSEYTLWCANRAGRINLRKGIAPPDSSHPRFNSRSNDIDYQIEADYAGLIAPGCPQEVIRLGETFGRLMNFGDGVWAGQFVGALYAAAFFTSDVDALLDEGLKAIPAESDYAQMVRSVRAWHREFPSDWTKAWEKVRAAYSSKFNPALRDSNGDIDVRLNGAAVVLGLVYGGGDFDRSMVIATRCGWDSDCNPSSVCGVLGCAKGLSGLDRKYTEKIDRETKFSYTSYNLPELFAVCEKLMRQVVVRDGGRIEKDADGKEWIVLPEKTPVPSPFVPSWKAGPVAGSRFTEAERAKLTHALNLPDAGMLKDPDPTVRVQKALDALWPGWKTSPNGPDLDPGYRESVGTPEEALYGCVLTHPPKKGVPVKLSRTLKVPEGDPKLHFTVGNSPKGDFRLVVRVNGTAILATVLDKTLRGTSLCPFQTFDLSLEPWAGQTVTVELVQEPTGWYHESATWHDIRIAANNGVS